MEEEREVMEVDVLFVGGGVASLSGAYHLVNLVKAHNEKVDAGGEGERLADPVIAVLEKGPYVGAHSLSGAVIDIAPLRELVPDYMEKGAPLDARVAKEDISLLTKGGRIKSPITPPPLKNHGNYIVSLAKLTEWLGSLVEAQESYVFAGFAGTEILYDGDRVVGVRAGDKGIGPDGEKKSNFEPGIDLKAKVTVFGEGPRGSLTKTLIKRFALDKDKNPPSYVVGVKEVWELPEGRVEPGKVYHTMGYPLRSDTYGGGFIYCMENNLVSLGLLVGLDYADPAIDPHLLFQKFKQHSMVSELLREGKIVQCGAKTAPVGGYFSIPKLTFDGGLLVGDSANLFISQKIKGIHVAMKSGMLAAETIFQALLANDTSGARLAAYEKNLYTSDVGRELRKVRNFHQAFQNGLYRAIIKAGFQYLLGGRILKDRLHTEPDHSHLRSVKDVYGTDSLTDEQLGSMKFDGTLTFDKETAVYHSGTTHEEQQPAHLKVLDLDICYNRCLKEYQAPCQRFCPANVYEIELDEETGKAGLKVNFSNCLHCKTCDVKDPYENIDWVPPEGGGGPKFTVL